MKLILLSLFILIAGVIAHSSPNGRCGGRKGYTCEGYEYGSCCSQWGWCGSSSDYCGDGCQSEYGACVESHPSPPPSSHSSGKVVSPSGHCSGKKGYTCLGSDDGDCCSEYGYCGDTSAYCGKGCQPEFGLCKGSTPSRILSSKRPSASSRAATSSSRRRTSSVNRSTYSLRPSSYSARPSSSFVRPRSSSSIRPSSSSVRSGLSSVGYSSSSSIRSWSSSSRFSSSSSSASPSSSFLKSSSSSSTGGSISSSTSSLVSAASPSSSLLKSSSSSAGGSISSSTSSLISSSSIALLISSSSLIVSSSTLSSTSSLIASFSPSSSSSILPESSYISSIISSSSSAEDVPSSTLSSVPAASSSCVPVETEVDREVLINGSFETGSFTDFTVTDTNNHNFRVVQSTDGISTAADGLSFATFDITGSDSAPGIQLEQTLVGVPAGVFITCDLRVNLHADSTDFVRVFYQVEVDGQLCIDTETDPTSGFTPPFSGQSGFTTTNPDPTFIFRIPLILDPSSTSAFFGVDAITVTASTFIEVCPSV